MDPKTENVLRLRRTFAAPRAQVFRAFTDPEVLKRWWLPGAGHSVPEATIDLRAGGSYRIVMRNPRGEVFQLLGTYREVVPPERLVYTWRWEGLESETGDTLVTVEFRDLGGATEVVVTHERFPDAAARDRHERGWSACLDHLGEV